MILKDFLTGGFPITRRTPVICSFADGSVEVAYNRYTLKKVTMRTEKSVCLGVWPGKKNTDCFLIDPKYYCEKVPSEKHANIDSAAEIKVIKDEEGVFQGVEYIPGAFALDQTPVVSREKELWEYIKYARLKYKRVIGALYGI